MGLCFSFLKKPVTDKVSSDEANDTLRIGVCSMQGWRCNQEDAHNCILDYDDNTSLFAVFDGHGGHEVAAYCSQKLPQYIKDTEAYKSGDLERALVDGFLGFDALITTPEVIEELKLIPDPSVQESDSDSDSDIEENVSNLYEEASMPIEEVIKKYKSSSKHSRADEKESKADTSKGATSKDGCSSSDSVKNSVGDVSDSAVSSSSSSENLTKEESSDALAVSKPAEEHLQKETSVDSTDGEKLEDSSNKENCESKCDSELGKSQTVQNGELQAVENKESETKEQPQENGEVSKKGKGKATAKTKGVPEPSPKKTRPTRNAQQLYNKLLDLQSESESDSDDEEDKTFEVLNESSSEEDQNVPENESDASDASVEDEEPEEEDEEENDEETSDDEDKPKRKKKAFKPPENPGSDSGCTAVVAILRGNQLYVANAGDSRCIVCRDGQAVEMSLDHTPEVEVERERIYKAGGHVNFEGRVNGGLNLTRAIGDHSYKQNKDLPDREQMITALPDVRTLTINPKQDEFMVLACDGIWNCFSNQEVVDFIKPRLEKNPEKLSQIFEEMFDQSLASTSFCGGPGTDNMTAIIVQFKGSRLKRPPSCDEVEESKNIKRAKTEDTCSELDSTT